MSTMEHLLMQIFDRKSSIESQLKRQVECYAESLSLNLLTEGKKPPQWLWSIELGGLNNHDNKELNREQLISGILLPLPSHATPSNNAHFTMPARVCQSNNYMERAEYAEQMISDKDILNEHMQNKSDSNSGKRELKGIDNLMEFDPYTQLCPNDHELPLSNKENRSNSIRENSAEQNYSSRLPQPRSANVKADSVEQPSSTNDSLHHENVDRGRVTRSRSSAQSKCLESLNKLSDSFNHVMCIGSGECKVVETRTKTHTSNVKLSNTCTNGRPDIDTGFDKVTNVYSSSKMSHDVAPLPEVIQVIEPKRLHFDGTTECNFNENSHVSAEENNEALQDVATDLKEVMQPVAKYLVCSSFEKGNASDNDTSEHTVNADTAVTEYDAEQIGLKMVEVEHSECHSYPKSGYQILHQSINTKSIFESLVDKDDSVEVENVQHEQMTTVDSRTSVESNNSGCDCSKIDSMVIKSFLNLEKENIGSHSNDVDLKAISHDLSEASELEITLSESNYMHINMLAQPNEKASCISKSNPNMEYSGYEVVISDGGIKQSQVRAEVQTEEVIRADSALAFDKGNSFIKADIGLISSLKNSSSHSGEKSFSCKLSNSILPSSDDLIFGLSTPTVVNGSTMGIKETNATHIENATRYSYLLRSSSGPCIANDSECCSKANLMHLGTNENENLGNHIQSTPNKKRRLTSSVKSRYHLRSQNSNNKNEASSEISCRNSDTNLLQDIETRRHRYENSWPKRRKAHHRSNNILATSPRLIFKSRDCIKVGSESIVRSQPSFSTKSNTEPMDLEGYSYLIGNNHSAGKTNISSKTCLEGETNFNETTICAPLEHNSSKMDNTTENLLDVKHSTIVYVHDNDMRSQTSKTANSSQYDDVTMPEYEGFNMISSSFVDDKTILSNSNPSVKGNERVSLLEQLSDSRNMIDFESCPSTNYKMNNVPIACQSLPDMDQFLKHINRGINSDIDASFNGRPYSHSMPYSRNKIYPETRKNPLTPPIMKFNQKTISGTSDASSEKHGSNPEFVCFRIDENSSISDVKEHAQEFDPFKEHISHGDKMEFTRKDTLTDRVQSVTEARACLSHTTRCAVNRKSKIDNGNVDIKYPVRKAGLSLRNRSTKPRISGKLSEPSKNRDNIDKVYNPSKVVSNINSFSPLVFKTQQAAAPMKGRKDIKVKALEAAELSKRREKKRQNERELRKAAAKLEREKLHRENNRLLEFKQKQKEEEKKKKDAEVATRKRQREEEKGREQKRRCFSKTPRQKDEMENMLQPKVAKKETMVEDTKGKLPKKSGMQFNRVNALTVVNINQKPVDVGKVLSVPKGSQEVPRTITSVNNESRNVQSYELSPCTNSDDEDEEEEARHGNKFVPLWARGEYLDNIIFSKCQLDPAEIFCRKRSFIANEVLQMPTVLQPMK